jgi:hypothetical protein
LYFILALGVSIITGVHPLMMTGPAQGASCRSQYDLCRRVRADPVRTKPNPAMIGSCEVRYARASFKVQSPIITELTYDHPKRRLQLRAASPYD